MIETKVPSTEQLKELFCFVSAFERAKQLSACTFCGHSDLWPTTTLRFSEFPVFWLRQHCCLIPKTCGKTVGAATRVRCIFKHFADFHSSESFISAQLRTRTSFWVYHRHLESPSSCRQVIENSLLSFTNQLFLLLDRYLNGRLMFPIGRVFICINAMPFMSSFVRQKRAARARVCQRVRPSWLNKAVKCSQVGDLFFVPHAGHKALMNQFADVLVFNENYDLAAHLQQ